VTLASVVEKVLSSEKARREAQIMNRAGKSTIRTMFIGVEGSEKLFKVLIIITNRE
jgi:hypothetical protein